MNTKTHKLLLHVRGDMVVLLEVNEKDAEIIRKFESLAKDEQVDTLIMTLDGYKDFYAIQGEKETLRAVFPGFTRFSTCEEVDDFQPFRDRLEKLCPKIPDRPNPKGHLSISVRNTLSLVKVPPIYTYDPSTFLYDGKDMAFKNHKGCYIDRFPIDDLCGVLSNK